MPPKIFDLCVPRADVLAGSDSDFAADLAQVIRGTAAAEYATPAKFFDTTYPTRGLKNLLAQVCGRLSGGGGETASIFRLDTQFGGGKTHALIALVHAARSTHGVENIAEFIDPKLLPKGNVRIAAFDGENADPLNGRTMGDDIRARTPWGEIAYALAGKEGYERVRASDEARIAPGAETLRELFGGEPVLILLDELSVYLRKVKNFGTAGDQLAAFLTSLFKAVEGTTNAAVVYTLAIGKDSKSSDAYSDENQYVASRMAEAESISARKATLLNPTEDDETAHVLRRRLFGSVDNRQVPAVVEAYRVLWKQHASALSKKAQRPETAESFMSSYPFHPEVLDTLTEKAATLSNFQRVRGMLRLLARTIAHLWVQRPDDAYAIHLHHIDVGYEPIRQELVTRLGQTQYAPVLRGEIGSDGGSKSLAQEIDADNYGGMPPFASYAARTIFLHTLAFSDQVRGLNPDELRFSMIGPGTDVSFADDARKRFVAESAFLDDRPGAPMRFLAEANLTQIIRRQEAQVDAEESRIQLRDRIKQIFSRNGEAKFDLIAFPGGAYEVPDESGDSRPLLVVMGYDAVSVGGTVEAAPHLVERIFKHKGAEDASLRMNRNALVFLVAEEARKNEMREKVVRRLALRELKTPERMNDLAEHQQITIRELEGRAEQDVAIAIQQCFRHLFYPSRADRIVDTLDIAHTAIDMPLASASPGAGQKSIERALRDSKKLRISGDEPDVPTYVRDRTPLKKGEITTRALREEFRRDPNLPMLVGDDVFIRGIRRGVEQGEYVYRRGDLLYGEGDPSVSIEIDEQSTLFTMLYAKEHAIWPRPVVAPELHVSIAPTSHAAVASHENKPAPAATSPQRTSGSDVFEAEGVLKESLSHLWEKVRARKLTHIHFLKIRVFDPSDAFKLLGVVGAVQGAQKTVTFVGEYETSEGGSFQFKFVGPSSEAQTIKEFLDPQLRAATDKEFNATFEFSFSAGLAFVNDAPEKLAEVLTRYAAGSAFVSASAESNASSGAKS